MGGNETALEFAVVRDIEIGTLEAVDDRRKGRCVRDILIDNVMHG